MRVVHPDVLKGQLSRSQWLGWMAWMKVRGPIGPTRQDQYAILLARAAAGQVDVHTVTDLLRWLTPEPEADE